MYLTYFDHQSNNCDSHQILICKAVHQNSFNLKSNINLVRHAILQKNYRYENFSRNFIYLIKNLLIFIIRYHRFNLVPQIFGFKNDWPKQIHLNYLK